MGQTARSQLFAAARRRERHERMTRQEMGPLTCRETDSVGVFCQERGDVQHEYEFYAHAAQDPSVLSEPQRSVLLDYAL